GRSREHSSHATGAPPSIGPRECRPRRGHASVRWRSTCSRSDEPMTPRRSDFDLQALYAALDEQRRGRQMTWSEVAAEVNQHRTRLRPIAVSTIKSLEHKPRGEGDGILQMLVWLRKTPESFVPGATDPRSEVFCRP